ncbi:MAG: hypothetical protein ACP5NV_06215 [Candidatus Woesearchaeota archaeon]
MFKLLPPPDYVGACHETDLSDYFPIGYDVSKVINSLPSGLTIRRENESVFDAGQTFFEFRGSYVDAIKAISNFSNIAVNYLKNSGSKYNSINYEQFN